MCAHEEKGHSGRRCARAGVPPERGRTRGAGSGVGGGGVALPRAAAGVQARGGQPEEDAAREPRALHGRVHATAEAGHRHRALPRAHALPRAARAPRALHPQPRHPHRPADHAGLLLLSTPAF